VTHPAADDTDSVSGAPDGHPSYASAASGPFAPDPSQGETPVTATQTTSSTPAWRIAVIGVVAALAVGIGVVLGSGMLQSRATLIGSGASYVPATAPFYAEVRLEPSEAQDAALREFLGHFPEVEGIDLSQPLYAQLTAKLDEAIAEEGTDLSWSADVDPWFDGRVGVAVLDVPALTLDEAMPEPTMFGMPSTVALLGVTDRAAAQTSIDRIIAESEASVTFTQQEHSGVTINVDESSGAAYALTDDQLIIGLAVDDIVAALDAHASSSTTLSEAGSITSLTEALPDEWLAFGIYDFTDVLAGAFEGPAAASPGADVMRELLANQPMRGAMALTVEGDRVSVPMVSDPPTGSFAVTNADRGLADEVPGDALYYAEGGNVGASLGGVIGSLKESVGAMPDAAAQIDMVEAALGGDLEEQVAWMGDLATVAGFDGEEPWGGAIIVPTSMEDARRTMDQLSTFAGLATLDPSIGISVEERTVDDVEVTSLRWSDPSRPSEPPPPDMPMPFAPPEVVVEWAVTEDRVLLGVGDRFIERVLGQDSSGSLAETPRYSDAVAELGGPSNAGVTWVDLRGVRTALEAALGDLDSEGMYEAALPWLEPLDRIVAVSRIDGDVLSNESVLIVE
jgi:hypothetical protein